MTYAQRAGQQPDEPASPAGGDAKSAGEEEESAADSLQEPPERPSDDDEERAVAAGGPANGEKLKRARVTSSGAEDGDDGEGGQEKEAAAAAAAVEEVDDEDQNRRRKRSHTGGGGGGDKGSGQNGCEASEDGAKEKGTRDVAENCTPAVDAQTPASASAPDAVSATGSAAPSLPSNGSESTAPVSLPSWVKAIPSSRTLPTANAALSDEQMAALERARAYAREVQPMLLAKVPKAAIPRPMLPLPGLPAVPPIPIPGIITGADPRVVNMMSRVYVGSIPFEVTDQHMRVVFTQFGYINNIGMNLDPATGKHKGFCFVEYEAPEAAVLALSTMDGFELGGRKLRVGRPNNYNPQSALTLPPPPKSRIYVSNVSEYVTEENITSIFEPFGQIVKCILIPDFATRKHKNYGYIEFEEETAAQTAVESMNNFDLGGLQLHVILAVLGGGMGEGMKALQRVPPLPGVGNASTPGGPSGLTAGALAAHTTAARIASDLANKGQIPSVNETVAREENLSISSSQRYAIMQALARNESVSAAATGSAPAAPPAAFSSILLVRNAVSAADVDDELREEFAEECGKFGRVTRVHVHVDKSSTGEGLSEEDGRKQGDGDVRIFIQFTLPEAAERARTNLDGRWFGGRRIKATLYDAGKFHAGHYS